MKEWLIKQMFSSKKFWYAIGSILIPAIVTYLGVSESTAQEILHLKGEVEELRKQLGNLKDTIPTICKGLVEEPMSDIKKKVTKGDVVRFMKKMGWSE